MSAALVGLVLVAVAWTGQLSSSTSSASSSAGSFQVPARRQPLTTESGSPVAHDNEVMALAAHSGRLFAATDQWEYPGPSASGQVLVKDSGSGPWKVFEQTQSLRVQAIESFPIPADQGLGPGHSLLITRIISRIRNFFQIDVPIHAFFETPTVAAIAGRIQSELQSGKPNPPAPNQIIPRRSVLQSI